LRLLALLSIAVLISCSIGPEYNQSDLHRKTLQGKKIWNEAPEIDTKKPDSNWWRHFNDEFLNTLIKEAVAASLDIEIRLKRVNEAGLSINESGSRFLPSVNLTGNTSYFLQKIEEINVSEPILNEDDLEQRIEDTVSTIDDSEYYNLGLNVNWEFDLWGKKKKNYLSMKASYEESRALYCGEYLRIISDVAKTYFDIRKNDNERSLNKKLTNMSLEKLSIYRNQYSEGLINQWKLIRQQEEINNQEKELLELDRNRKRLENKLALLLGKQPGNIKIPNTSQKGIIELIKIPPGLPSDLLSARPDIIAAEYRVKKAYYKIGESMAARLPSISLTGQAGLASVALSKLLSQWTLGITPVLSLPIFDGGAKKKQVEISRLQAEIAEKEYINTVLRAFEEVENTLSDINNRKEQKAILENKFKIIEQINTLLITDYKL